MNEGFVKSASMRLIGLFITQMPFAEDARCVAGRLEHLWQNGSFERHALAFQDRMGDAVLQRMPPGHDGAARR